MMAQLSRIVIIGRFFCASCQNGEDERGGMTSVLLGSEMSHLRLSNLAGIRILMYPDAKPLFGKEFYFAGSSGCFY